MIVLSFDLCVSTCLIAKWLKWCFEVWSSTLLGGMICDMSSGYVAIIAILLLSSVVQFRQTQLTRLYLCHQNGCMVSVYSKFCICMYMHICVLYIYIYIYLCTYIYIYICMCHTHYLIEHNEWGWYDSIFGWVSVFSRLSSTAALTCSAWGSRWSTTRRCHDQLASPLIWVLFV